MIKLLHKFILSRHRSSTTTILSRASIAYVRPSYRNFVDHFWTTLYTSLHPSTLAFLPHVLHFPSTFAVSPPPSPSFHLYHLESTRGAVRPVFVLFCPVERAPAVPPSSLDVRGRVSTPYYTAAPWKRCCWCQSRIDLTLTLADYKSDQLGAHCARRIRIDGRSVPRWRQPPWFHRPIFRWIGLMSASCAGIDVPRARREFFCSKIVTFPQFWVYLSKRKTDNKFINNFSIISIRWYHSDEFKNSVLT